EANPASRPFPSARLPLIDAPLPETRIPALPTPAEKPFPDAVDDLIDTESAKAAMPKLRLPEAIDEVTCPPSPTAIPVRPFPVATVDLTRAPGPSTCTPMEPFLQDAVVVVPHHAVLDRHVVLTGGSVDPVLARPAVASDREPLQID